MVKNKNRKADKPLYHGCVTFDGNLKITINGELKTLRTDLGGLSLRKADSNKELIVLTRDHVGYNEIDTGYIVRAKIYDDGNPPYFGLKDNPDALSWGCFNYCDVIAWGYADGGLNDPTLFYSCQSTVEEEIEREKRRAEKGMKTHAERLAEMESEDDYLEDKAQNNGVVFKFKNDGVSIKSETSWPKEGGSEINIPDNLLPLLKATVDCFGKINDDYPEIKEVHFFTEMNVWESDADDDQEPPKNE